jgi:hypothetical protein
MIHGDHKNSCEPLCIKQFSLKINLNNKEEEKGAITKNEYREEKR